MQKKNKLKAHPNGVLMKESVISRMLLEPSYGYVKEGELVKPAMLTLIKEWFIRINILASRKNWYTFFCTGALVLSTVILALFFIQYFAWLPLIVASIFAAIILGVQQTIWHHRYCTHHSYKINSNWVKVLIRNMVPRFLLEEVYVVSHYVHHALSDQPGDPYNAKGGFWYCMFSEENQQCTARDLNENDYNKVRKLLTHSGIYTNNYEEYQTWGTVSNPYHTIPNVIANWMIWYSLLYLLGGHSWATAVIGINSVYLLALRHFNYEGHGNGKEAWKEGSDFDRRSLAINQASYGLISGEWHNNHHLYPNSANTGFQKNQIDLAFQTILVMKYLGLVSHVRDSKNDFLEKYIHQKDFIP